MKKILPFIVLLFMSIASASGQQIDHMKFMGIPLNGTINQFQAKLNAKGIVVDNALNKYISVGCRAFKGIFSGEKANIYVYYDETSKIVYRAKAVIADMDKDIYNNKYNKFVRLLSQKYTDAETSRGEQDGREAISYYIYGDEYNTMYEYLGRIDVYSSSYLSMRYSLHIDYTDTANDVKHEGNNMDDL